MTDRIVAKWTSIGRCRGGSVSRQGGETPTPKGLLPRLFGMATHAPWFARLSGPSYESQHSPRLAPTYTRAGGAVNRPSVVVGVPSGAAAAPLDTQPQFRGTGAHASTSRGSAISLRRCVPSCASALCRHRWGKQARGVGRSTSSAPPSRTVPPHDRGRPTYRLGADKVPQLTRCVAVKPRPPEDDRGTCRQVTLFGGCTEFLPNRSPGSSSALVTNANQDVPRPGGRRQGRP